MKQDLVSSITYPRSLSKEWQGKNQSQVSQPPVNLNSTAGHCLTCEPLNYFRKPVVHGRWSPQSPLNGKWRIILPEKDRRKTSTPPPSKPMHFLETHTSLCTEDEYFRNIAKNWFLKIKTKFNFFLISLLRLGILMLHVYMYMF